ncbi:DNA-directed RNA polymerase 7 kDa subunit, partial [Monkeypox virus]
NLTVQPLLD